MTKYFGFQYGVTYGTAVTRTEVTLCWRNQCETVQLLTLTPDFIAPALCIAKSPDFDPVDYKIRDKLQERVYRSRIMTLTRWNRTWSRVGIFPPGVHEWSGQAVASTSFSLHLSTWRTFWTQTLSMFDICTNVHFDSHMSVWLPIVFTYVSGDLTKPAITIAGIDRFYCRLIWHFVCS